MVKGKDFPCQLGKKEFDDLGGPTIGLMVRMTRNLWYTGKVVTMDSGFCVSHGIVQLHVKCVYEQALIKKRG